MVGEILTAAGIPNRESRFLRPPEKTYAVYFDAVEVDGPDGYNRIFTHDVTVEVYAEKTDTDAVTAIETELNARGIPWTKQGWYWLQDAQRYQEVYEFSYIVKI